LLMAVPVQPTPQPAPSSTIRAGRAGTAGRQSISAARRGLGMAASNTPGPDEPGELSAREKKILEGIEDDILTADPNLARKMTRAARHRPASPWRATARHGALLLAALIILIIAAAVLPPNW